MKKIILELLKKYFDSILENWTNFILKKTDKLSESQIRTFVSSSLNILIDITDKSDYSKADQYLVDIYNLFSEASLNLLEISDIFGQGRFAILNQIEKDFSQKYDPTVLLGYIDEIIEQVYARYGVIHQQAKMKEVTEDRNRLEAKLEMNQQYLKNILHASDTAIMVIDENEKFIAWNKGAEKIFGYTEEEIINSPSSLLLPEEEKFKDELKYIQDEIKSTGYVKILETERKSKDGTIIPVHLNVTRLPGSNGGSYGGRSVIIKDYTEVKKLQQQVDQSEKLAVIGQVAAGVAHEIGNPLASISSLVQIMQRTINDESLTDQLATIKENIDRITKIVRELVDFSRPPSYEQIAISVNDVVKTALGIVKYDKRVRKVKFETNLDENLSKINIVPDQVLQVFVNIMINALDAIEGEGNIIVNSRMVKNEVSVEIIDDGCGMDEKTLEHIFDPFFTTKEVGKGTGLGLSVSYGIIKKFHGKIEVESKLKKGTKFIVKLPVEE
ncbi:MAG: ATP-binding protein [Ignavibacteria bacterium]|jgi:PAS domain S-box-containing protein